MNPWHGAAGLLLTGVAILAVRLGYLYGAEAVALGVGIGCLAAGATFLLLLSTYQIVGKGR